MIDDIVVDVEDEDIIVVDGDDDDIVDIVVLLLLWGGYGDRECYCGGYGGIHEIYRWVSVCLSVTVIFWDCYCYGCDGWVRSTFCGCDCFEVVVGVGVNVELSYGLRLLWAAVSGWWGLSGCRSSQFLHFLCHGTRGVAARIGCRRGHTSRRSSSSCTNHWQWTRRSGNGNICPASPRLPPLLCHHLSTHVPTMQDC